MKDFLRASKKTKWKKAGCVVLIGFGMVASLSGCKGNDSSEASSSASGSASAEVQDVYHPDKAAGHFLTGNDSSAKVIITEFTDFQCPACAKMQPTIAELIEKYRGTDVAVVTRNFPLSSHDKAQIAAQAAEAAAAQGKYEEYISELYSTQTEWAGLKPEAAVTKFREIAKRLGYDLDRFNADMDSAETKDRIAKDQAAGAKAGVRGTPTLFVGPKQVSATPGATYADLQREIENMVVNESGGGS